MHAKDLKAVAGELLKTAELFGEVMAEGRIAVYLESLEDLPGPEVCEAFARLRRSSQWFPQPTQVRALVGGDTEMHAHDAWITLRGSDTPRIFRDDVGVRSLYAADQALQACGGWRWVKHDAPVKDTAYMYRQFIRAFVLATRSAEWADVATGGRVGLPPSAPPEEQLAP